MNRPIPSNPRLIDGNQARSDAIRDRVLGDISVVDQVGNLSTNPSGTTGEPTYYSRGSDPSFTLHCTLYACSLEGASIHIPAQAAPEGGWNAAPGADRHMTIIDQSTGWEYDLWQVKGSALPTPNGTLQVSSGGKSRVDGDCAGVAALGTTCGVGQGTAAHFADTAGRLRAEELQSGHINHALLVAIDCDSATIVYPANGHGQSCAYAHSTDPNKDPANPMFADPANPQNVNAPPMGALLQLDMTAAQIDALPIQPWKKVFLHAIAEYGMYFGETGAHGLFSIETESGNQYRVFGANDPWYTYGTANWELYTGAGTTEYVGKLYNRPGDPDPNLNWTTTVWSHIRVLDPCVVAETC
jgi:hypothetical protein